MTPPPAGDAPRYPPMNPVDERLWATVVHVCGIFFGVLSPLIGFLVLKDRGPFVRAHTKTALNFQITLALADILGWILVFVFIGVLILVAAWIVNIVFCIIAAAKANRGEWYTYVLAIGFVR